MAPKAFSISRRATTIAASSALALGGAFVLTTAFPASAQVMKPGDKVWVCKYVGKPGVDERLKDGKNPIEVGWQSADTNHDGNVSVGDEFSDAQGRSIVIQINGSDPGRSACPTEPAPPPVTTTTTTSTGTETTTSTGTETTTSTGTETTTSTGTETTTSTGTHTTTPSGNHTTTPSGTHTTKPSAPGGGGAVTPGVGAPETGGAGEGNPVNGLIGSGLLLSAAGLLAFDTLKRRRNALGKGD